VTHYGGIWRRWRFHLWCITRYHYQDNGPFPNSIPRSARMRICCVRVCWAFRCIRRSRISRWRRLFPGCGSSLRS